MKVPVLTLGLSLVVPVLAQDSDVEASVPLEDMLFDDGDLEDLTDLSLEELMNIDVEVTSVSRKSENLSETAAAVYVITSDDIRRSGATSIPELLRQAPGMHVARLTSDDYAISARGFAGEFSNKMLVLIDGRSVYSPLFSGVFWSSLDLALQDIERIEVIRGPGGTMWGANAVNGVINIITKSANSLDGVTTSVTVGNEDQFVSSIRGGGALGENGHLRVFMKSTERDSLQHPTDASYGGAEGVRGGFRADWDLDDQTTFSLQGNAYRTEGLRSITAFTATAPFVFPSDEFRRFEGGGLLGQWARAADDGSSTRIQAYYDRQEYGGTVFSEERDTFEIDYQYQMTPGERHQVMYGLMVRHTSSNSVPSPVITFDPSSRDDTLFSAFIQDEFQVNDSLRLIYGTKVEHNEFSGFEISPNIRFSMPQGDRSTLWGSISRAVRTPAQTNTDLDFVLGIIPNTPPGFTTILNLLGNEDIEAEEMIAYELGYRTKPTDSTSIDAAVFLHTYDNLMTYEFGTPSPGAGATIIQPLIFENMMEGVSYGAEIVGKMVLAEDWTMHLGYSFMELDLDVDASSTATASEDGENQHPHNQVHLRSYHDLSEEWELDASVWYVDNLGQTIDSYVRTDLRLGWQPNDNMRVSFGLNGLFHDDEQEFGAAEFGEYYGAQTAAYVKIDIGF